jgi:quercetin dioxygenase-like cupin family protein
VSGHSESRRGIESGEGFTVLRGDSLSFAPPSWRADVQDRTIVELPLHAELRGSRANLWRYPPGAAGKRHYHFVQQEIFLVVRGRFTIGLGEPPTYYELPPLSMAVVDPGVPIHVVNDSDEEGLIFVYGVPEDGSSVRTEEV